MSETNMQEQGNALKDPLSAVRFLINHRTIVPERKSLHNKPIPEHTVNTFNINELEEIAEHLLVYCKHQREA